MSEMTNPCVVRASEEHCESCTQPRSSSGRLTDGLRRTQLHEAVDNGVQVPKAPRQNKKQGYLYVPVVPGGRGPKTASDRRGNAGPRVRLNPSSLCITV